MAKRKTTNEFKDELARISPNIKVVGDYIGALKPIKVCCCTCNHQWETTPNSLLHNHRCPKCAKVALKITNEFISELAKVNSKIEVLGEYINTSTPIKVRCKICNYTWHTYPRSLLQSHGCPKCGAKNHSEKIMCSVLCVETKKIYKSLSEAAHAVGLKSSSPISLVLHGHGKTAAGYHWEYADTT